MSKKKVRFFVGNQDVTVEMPSFSITLEQAFSRRGGEPGIDQQLAELTRHVPASDLAPIAASNGWGWNRK